MSRTLTDKRRRIDEDYLDLISELPLRPIRNDSVHRAAQAILDRLIGRPDLSGGQKDYLAGLVRFVEEYERERYGAQFEAMDSIEILKFLMEANDLSTSDLGDLLGSRGLASEILNGKRGLSKTHIRKLAKRFALDPELFLGSE